VGIPLIGGKRLAVGVEGIDKWGNSKKGGKKVGGNAYASLPLGEGVFRGKGTRQRLSWGGGCEKVKGELGVPPSGKRVTLPKEGREERFFSNGRLRFRPVGRKESGLRDDRAGKTRSKVPGRGNGKGSYDAGPHAF